MAPLRFTGTPSEAADAVRDAVRACGGRIVEEGGGYFRAEFTSRWFRFVDDVELTIDEERRRVDFRSASRVGYSDLGANRRRMTRITGHLEHRGDFFCLEAVE